MLSKQRSARSLSLLACGALALGACSTADTGEGSGGGDGETQDQTIAFAWEQEFEAYNGNTSSQNATKNTVVLNRVLTQFWEYDPEGQVAPYEPFGSFQKTSDDPLTVEYTINEDAKWSDGEPIDCDDMVLKWAAQSGKFKKDDKDVFSPAATTGYEDMQQPQCEDGDKKFTVVYDEPFADWSASFDQFIMPAHIVEKEAKVEDLVAAVTDKDMDAIGKAAKFWNEGWVLKAGELKPDIMPSSGPYMIDSWTAGQSLTLKANPQWWGDAPKASTIVFRFIAGEQQSQALQNGEVQLISPQPQVDIVKQIDAIGDSVIKETGDRYIFEHVDFNFGTDFKDPEIRKAFAMCVPRETIVKNLIQPVNPEGTVMDGRYVFPFQDNYAGIVGATDAGEYAKPDIEGAKAILTAKGKTNMPVRIGYQTPNQRRTSTVQLIADSCKQAGFDVKDAGTDSFFGTEQPARNWDVALFGWAGSPLVSGNSSTYVTGGGNNFGDYSNPEVDAKTAELNKAVEESEQDRLITDIEKLLWSDLATIPLFAHPGVNAQAANLEGVVFQPSQSEVTWNMDQWTMAAE